MKMLVEKLVDGKQEFEVVEAESAPQSMNQCSLSFFIDKEGKPVVTEQDVSYVGVYEIGQTNLLESVDKLFNVHKFYRNKLQGLGIDPDTFENLQAH